MRPSITLLLCGFLVVSACSSESGGDAAAGTQRTEVVPVTVAEVVQKDVPVRLRAIGTVEAYSTVTVKSQVEGQLAHIHFREGDTVQKGELLFTIDPRWFEAALRQAEANLARDNAEARNADVDAERLARLYPQGLVSKAEFDQAKATAAALRAAVRADRAAVENAKLQVQYCSIRSPLGGRIGQLLAHAGNIAKANDTMLAVIHQMRPIYVSFAVPEQALPEIRTRAAADTLAVETSLRHQKDGTPIRGTLSFIDNTVNTSTGTVLLKGLFTNDDEALWPGQFVDVLLTLSVQRAAVVAPAAAIQTGQQGQYVFVVSEDSSVATRPVVLGYTSGQEVVVETGLQPGETVVTDGQLRLAPGARVQIKDGTQPGNRGT